MIPQPSESSGPFLSPPEVNITNISFPLRCSRFHVAYTLPCSNGDKTEQIAGIDAAVAVLLRQCAVLNRRRNSFQPAINLPVEILTLIFELVCRPLGFEDYFLAIIKRSFLRKPEEVGPFFISQVCSVWRNVALNSPQLWNSVKVVVSSKVAKKQAALLEYWLSNSGQRPLTVALVEDRFGRNQNRNQNKIPTDVIDVLAKYAHRLYTADLLMTSEWEPALLQIRRQAPLLTSLTLERPQMTQPINSTISFVAASRLISVSLFGYSLTNVLLPEQIKWLSLNRINTSDPHSVFRLFPYLQHCTLNTESYRHAWNVKNWTRQVTHSLLSLKLSLEKEADLKAILNKLALPRLYSFYLFIAAEISWKSLVLPFFKRSECALGTLTLCCRALPECDLIAGLRMLPTLHTLSLNYFGIGKLSKTTFDLMNPRTFRNGWPADSMKKFPCLLPNLKTFSFYCHTHIDVDSHALVEFLEDRWCYTNDNNKATDDGKVLVVRLEGAEFQWRMLNFQDEDMAILRRLKR
ncbi:hypothetical protein BDN70DRAFT_946980 [Pholiota conissans]|uniref:F-box domain-containing protein n=1 Tax=Pholiota conissans TaxID=109636 RepID=A0A9P5ZBX2_9AGAR|nr:hypothetical protein BDN70DRAFT_946980 [Pholiota conissans]